MNDTPTTSLEHYQHLHSQIISLAERLLTLVEGLRSPTLLDEMKHVRSQIDAITIKILVAGELNVGKSTIINALLKTKVLPAYPIPTTALVTHVKRGKHTQVVLHQCPSSEGTRQPPLEIALTEMESYLMFDRNREQMHNFERAEIFLPLPSLDNGVEFVDIVSPYDDDGYEDALKLQVPSADVILYVPGCDTLPSKEEALCVDRIRKAGHETLLFLCNRFDLVEPQSQRIVKRRYFTYLCQHTSNGASAVFFTNAKGALDGYLHSDTRQIAQSNMSQVREALNDIIAERGNQKIQPIISRLKYAIGMSLRVASASKELQHSNSQTRMESRTKLRYHCKHIEEERLHTDNLFDAIRQQIRKEVQSAAMSFYGECVHMLESRIQDYVPGQISSVWDVFSGNTANRLTKDIITFLSEMIHDQFHDWITSTVEPLLQERLGPVCAALSQNTAACIAQAVEHRINFTWHCTPLIKRICENAEPNSYAEPGSDLQQIKTRLMRVYQRELEKSTRQLVAAITDTIDSELRQKQQGLVHPLDLELQCLHDVVRTSVAEEQEREDSRDITSGSLQPTLEDELHTIDRELCDLTKTIPMTNIILQETNNEHESVDQSQSKAFKSSTIPPADK